MINVGIISLGHYLPERVINNHDLEQMVDTSDEWIRVRTGIQERRIAAKDEDTSDMAIKAAEEAIRNADMDPSMIELIVVATASADSHFPAVACLVQKAVGAHQAAAFDVNAACSGFLCALTTAKQYVQTGLYKNALVVAAEKFSKLIDWNDRSTCVLFGDGAGACLLGLAQAGEGILSEFMHAQGIYGHLLEVIEEERKPLDQGCQAVQPPYVQMNGQALFKVAVNSMVEAADKAIQKARLRLEDIDCVVPHQANDRIISGVAKKLKLPKEKFFINIEKYGNMSAASVLVALYEAVDQNRIHKGDHVLMVTFGAGLVAAANVVKW
jgi:3-oxoacyl-[acyl-carrier-protein] synthase-3